MEPHFVAFIDILGFSQMVSADCRHPNQKFEHLNKLRKVMARIGLPTESKIKYVQFSDSIVLSRPYDPTATVEFIASCRDLQAALFQERILCRGGVAQGMHFMDESFLFSEGLILAYRLEAETARVPRIVISKDLIDLVNYTNPNTDLTHLVTDNDREFFIDYISQLRSEDVGVILDDLSASTPSSSVSILEKINWLYDLCYFLKKIPIEQKKPQFVIPQFSLRISTDN